jgi:hypothetical protein
VRTFKHSPTHKHHTKSIKFNILRPTHAPTKSGTHKHLVQHPKA